MIVCHCHRVSDRDIRGSVREGASSVSEVGRACKAGTACGGCRPEIASIVASEPDASSLVTLSLVSSLRRAG